MATARGLVDRVVDFVPIDGELDAWNPCVYAGRQAVWCLLKETKYPLLGTILTINPDLTL